MLERTGRSRRALWTAARLWTTPSPSGGTLAPMDPVTPMPPVDPDGPR
ncbi:hypothetical protein SSCG_03011 [Streptomyces clavuligerus]|nr:hypothetical protein SSCG_03011 [Streptomyces clavuligerus]